MTPFYYVEESDGEYKIINDGTGIDQNMLSQYCHNSITNWISDVATGNTTASGDTYEQGTPFFAYYATPWPHAPIYAGQLAEKPKYSYNYDTHKWEKSESETVLVGQGSTGVGIYADNVTEFDYYLGELFYNMQEAGVLDNTIIMFTSDNGPALQGSTDDLRGGKYTAYEGGQKVPFYMRWGGNEYMYVNDTTKAQDNYAEDENGNSQGIVIDAQATLVDFFPTLIELCGINGQVGDQVYQNMMPFDREIDGVSMVSLFMPDENGNTSDFIHDKDRPILYMKREVIKSVSYAMTKEETLDLIVGQEVKLINNQGLDTTYTMTEDMANSYDFIRDNDVLVWKYFKSMQNDNPAFFDKVRKNWLICLSDDRTESYQRADVFPMVASQLKDVINTWTQKFNDNRRGINRDYYQDNSINYNYYYDLLKK